jgi:hypothetical protein
MMRRNRGRDLHFIHSVRPALELSDPLRRSKVPIVTAGALIAAALLMLMFGR